MLSILQITQEIKTQLSFTASTKPNKIPAKKANRLSPAPILLAFALYDLKEDSTSASSTLNLERNLILRSKDIVMPKIWPSKLLISLWRIGQTIERKV